MSPNVASLPGQCRELDGPVDRFSGPATVPNRCMSQLAACPGSAPFFRVHDRAFAPSQNVSSQNTLFGETQASANSETGGGGSLGHGHRQAVSVGLERGLSQSKTCERLSAPIARGGSLRRPAFSLRGGAHRLRARLAKARANGINLIYDVRSNVTRV